MNNEYATKDIDIKYEREDEDDISQIQDIKLENTTDTDECMYAKYNMIHTEEIKEEYAKFDLGKSLISNVETIEFVNIKVEHNDDSNKAESLLDNIIDPIATNNGVFKCNYCMEAFTTFEYYHQHETRCSSNVYGQQLSSTDKGSAVPEKKKQKYVCKSKKLNIKLDLNEFKCSLCKQMFSKAGNLKAHMRIHTGERPFKCPQCGQMFIQLNHLKQHINTHTGERPFKCSICQQAYAQSGNLRGHMRTHTGERPFECSICKQAFAQSSHLRGHMRTHTGEKPFKCNHCEQRFTQLNHLKQHINTHTGERPFKCSICEQAFTQSSNLKGHMRTHTGEKPYECSICKQAFAYSSSLKTHLRVHTGEKPFECSKCKKAFTDSANLRRHMRKH